MSISDPIRRLTADDAGNVTDAVTSARTNDDKTLNTFQRAVVVEVLDNLTLIDWDDEEVVTKLDATIKNKEDLRIAPRNSIIANIISNAKGKTSTKNQVCFPFFSSLPALARPVVLAWCLRVIAVWL